MCVCVCVCAHDFPFAEECVSKDTHAVCRQLIEAMGYRMMNVPEKDCSLTLPKADAPRAPRSNHEIRLARGVYLVYNNHASSAARYKPRDFHSFVQEYAKLMALAQNPAAVSFCSRRLALLKAKFDTHLVP